ncbi:acyltransferase [Sphingobium sufflavum]|uniref:acyltransferase family protein n=1 Tax=Sphingobium sufflavum TaxID=1129547 RepID=UPI001F43ADF8|nr:acyltransferase [Sphingobium sufflavum]MCE7795670.1 acyltransferase [Sphingobium sufflavum]
MTSSGPEARSGGRVREIDALRGIGALIIILFHYTSRFPDMFPGAAHVGLNIDAGYDGVVVFFALSGFALQFSIRRLNHVGDFAFGRFARLFPAYWAAMAVTLAVQALAPIPRFALPTIDMLVNPTMLQGFAHLESIDGAYWTLAVELAFYACMAVVWRLGRLARLERVLAGWIALALLMHSWHGFPEPVAQLLVLRHIPFFAIGLVSYRVHDGARTWAQQVPILAMVFFCVALVEQGQVLVICALTLAFFVAMTDGRLGFVCNRPLLWVGAISYPLYLVHQHVGMTVMAKASDAGVDPWIALVAAIMLALGLGFAIHRWIERPAGDWLLRRWNAVRVEAHRPPPGVSRRRRLDELDALRGVGAILVLNYHYSSRYPELFPGRPHVPFHLFSGNYRVMLFFAISGFAIFFTMKHLKRASDFVVNRMARLLPVYWVALTLTLTAEYLGNAPQLQIPFSAAVVNLSMLQAYFYVPAIDGAYWTLAFEIGFYVCILGLWGLGLLRRIEPALLGWLFCKWVMFYWAGMPTRLAELMVLNWIPFFGIGLLSYRVWAGERTWRDQIPYVLAILFTAAQTCPPEQLLAAIAITGGFMAMVEGRLGWLCARPLLWLGGISYSLYLVHQNIGFVVMLNSDRLGLHPAVGYGLATATAVLLGALLNRTVERPVGAWIMRRWAARGERVLQGATGRA